MSADEFTRKFAECFYQIDSDAIDPSTEFKKLDEWGSMMALIVIAMIDSEFGKTITADDLRQANSIADLFEIVKGK